MRRMMLMTVGVATILALAGCGSSSSDSSSANPADVAAVAKQVGTGGEFSKAQAACVANHAVPNLSAKGIKAAKSSSTNSDLTDLSKSDQNAIFDSVSACVKTSDLAPLLEKSLETGSDKVDAKSAKCFTTALLSVYPKSGDMMRDMTANKTSKVEKAATKCFTGLGSADTGSSATSGSDSGSSDSGSADSTTTIAGAGADVSTAAIKSALVGEMTKGGMTSTQANCVADKVLSEVSVADLEQAGSSGSLSNDVQTKVEAAAASCVAAG